MKTLPLFLFLQDTTTTGDKAYDQGYEFGYFIGSNLPWILLFMAVMIISIVWKKRKS